MKFTKRNKSTIDTLFLFALLGVFLVSVLFVILFGAKIYKKTNAVADHNFDVRTSAAYITEKIRKAGSDNIAVSRDNRLEIYETAGDSTYITYLYYDENKIKEVTMLDSDAFSPDYGTAIISAEDFTVNKVGKDLIKFSITTADDTETVFYVSASGKGGSGNE